MTGPNPFNDPAISEYRDNVQVPNVNMQLSRIDLPTFSVTYDDWHPFQDIFHSMIHENTALPTIQKMHYVRASLKGEAADLISSLELSAENYAEAWIMLNPIRVSLFLSPSQVIVGCFRPKAS